MTDAVQVGIIAASATIIAGAISAVGVILARKVREVHTLINSGLDKRIAAEVAKAILEGREQGRQIAITERAQSITEAERIEDREQGLNR